MTWTILILCLLVIAILYVKGKEDAETFDGEIRLLLFKIRNSPVTETYYLHILKEFKKINKLPHRDRETISVAKVEFGYKFQRFVLKDSGC